jgi:hypothetical protein
MNGLSMCHAALVTYCRAFPTSCVGGCGGTSVGLARQQQQQTQGTTQHAYRQAAAVQQSSRWVGREAQGCRDANALHRGPPVLYW